jgi:hypothetical protein
LKLTGLARGSIWELANSMADAKAKEARVSGERLTVDLSYGEEPGGYSIFLGGKRVRRHPWKELKRCIRQENYNSWKTKSKTQKGLSTQTGLDGLEDYVRSLTTYGVSMASILMSTTGAMFQTKKAKTGMRVPHMLCKLCTVKGEEEVLDLNHLLDCENEAGWDEEVSSIAGTLGVQWRTTATEADEEIGDELQSKIDDMKRNSHNKKGNMTAFKIRRKTMKEVDEAVRRYIERNAEQSYGESFKTVEDSILSVNFLIRLFNS